MCGVSWLTQAARPILYKHQSLATWDTVSQALKTLDESVRIQRIINYVLGDIVLPVQAGPVTLNVQFSVQLLGPATKIPRSRSLTNNPNFGGKHSSHKHQFPHDTEETQSMQNILRQNHDIFAWAHSDMKGIHPSIASHRLNVFSTARPVR
ncbi:hypothetical protein CK203_006775 [Vitis vinifera]|uniref:Uncharacterized protein n=1 Tax=Vitis vinifera TaxID=29760 RepID=A0A438KBF8_VITVI|nr:hypothetical protein CK203_006775 [Vitis vinifera]